MTSLDAIKICKKIYKTCTSFLRVASGLYANFVADVSIVSGGSKYFDSRGICKPSFVLIKNHGDFYSYLMLGIVMKICFLGAYTHSAMISLTVFEYLVAVSFTALILVSFVVIRCMNIWNLFNYSRTGIIASKALQILSFRRIYIYF